MTEVNTEVNTVWQLPGWQQEKQQAAQYSMLTLAYIGDAVYELLVRQHTIREDMVKVKKIHQKNIHLVCAETQAALALAIEPILSDGEKDILRRGRNAKGGHLPKNTSAPTYRLATGLEALIGYLYLAQNIAKLEQIFSLLWQWEAVGEIPNAKGSLGQADRQMIPGETVAETEVNQEEVIGLDQEHNQMLAANTVAPIK